MNRTDFLARLRQALQGLPSRSTILSPITTRISARRWLHKIGLIYGFQNAAMLGNDASRVEIAQWPAHLPLTIMASGPPDSSGLPRQR